MKVPSCLSSHFNAGCNQNSPVFPETELVQLVDKDGVERPTFPLVDLKKVTASFGSIYDWSVSALSKAGINPAMNIHTSGASRIEGSNDLKSVVADVEKNLPNESESSNS